MEKAQLFIRDDDVWSLDETFRFFFEQAWDRGIPIVYAVIPGKMDEDLIKFLCDAKRKNPALIDIVQHGWVHDNHSEEKGKKYEFGGFRTSKVQRADIQQGRKLMGSMFKDLFTPVFVPPFHGHDDQTLSILQDEGFLAFSAGASKMKKVGGLREFPARISFSRYDRDVVSINSAEDVLQMLVQDIRVGPLSGIVTHHDDFKTADSQKQLIRFFDLLVKLRDRRELKILLLFDLLEKQ